jgi:hypothetical protein
MGLLAGLLGPAVGFLANSKNAVSLGEKVGLLGLLASKIHWFRKRQYSCTGTNTDSAYYWSPLKGRGPQYACMLSVRRVRGTTCTSVY